MIRIVFGSSVCAIATTVSLSRPNVMNQSSPWASRSSATVSVPPRKTEGASSKSKPCLRRLTLRFLSSHSCALSIVATISSYVNVRHRCDAPREKLFFVGPSAKRRAQEVWPCRSPKLDRGSNVFCVQRNCQLNRRPSKQDIPESPHETRRCFLGSSSPDG